MPKTSYKEIQHLDYDDIQIPIEIYHELRQSARVSLSKNKAILRIPLLIAHTSKEKHVNWAKDWILKKLKKDHQLLKHFNPKEYKTGDEIKVRETVFQLHIEETVGRNSASGRRKGHILYIQIPGSLSLRQRQETCSNIIHRIMSNTYAEHIKKRVDEINDKYFQKEINEIKLRNNSSNWGSCSINKNISLSSRLLLAPNFVLDYIIIHELAHLVHHNHSDRYWNLVEKVMPDYMEAEKWLKKFGGTIDW